MLNCDENWNVNSERNAKIHTHTQIDIFSDEAEAYGSTVNPKSSKKNSQVLRLPRFKKVDREIEISQEKSESWVKNGSHDTEIKLYDEQKRK